jgi:membrane-associated phospholipid phosphatase
MATLDRNSASADAAAQRRLSPMTRLAWLIAVLAVQSLYIPINRTVQGGVILATPWDVYFPLRPIWVLPYLLSLAWWTACFAWAAWKMDDDLYRAFVLSILAVMLASYLVYILYPTYVVRPTPAGDGWLERVVQSLYVNDRVNNAFPSGHTYNSVLIALYWSRWHPRQRWLWWAITAIILLSTLFTRQHNLPDLVGGIAFAWLAYRLGLWWVARRQSEG